MSDRIVLVHGAWGSALSWGPVARALKRAGKDVLAIDLPGHGDDPTPPDDVDLDDYTDRVVAALESGPPALLVAHSMGGMVISGAADRAPGKVRKLAYVCAFLPQDGESLLDLLKRAPNTIPDAILPGPVDGTSRLDPARAMAILAQDAPATMQQQIAAHLQVQPNAPQTDAIRLGKNLDSLPKAYVTCRQDRTILPALQDFMQDRAGVTERYALNTGHLPMMTAPAKLTEILLGL